MSPYFIERDGKVHQVGRVTEVTGAGDCIATADFEKRLPYERIRTAHSVTVPGTIAHIRIEQRIRKQFGMAETRFNPDKATAMLMRKQVRLHYQQKKENPRTKTAWDVTQQKVEQCMKNFEEFFQTYPTKPYLGMIEQRVYSPHFDYAGTVDLPFESIMKGRLVKLRHLPDELADQLPYADERVFFLECDCEPVCECAHYKVLTILDWKTSSRKQKGHARQLSAYHLGFEEMGIFEKARKMGVYPNWHCWSVLLGEHGLKRTTTGYQLVKYPADFTAFLENLGSFKEPRNISMNTSGDVGLKGRCMFCADFMRCPDRINWHPGYPDEVALASWTEQELLTIVMMFDQVLEQFPQFEDVREKAADLYDQLMEIKEGKTGLDIEINGVLQGIGLETVPIEHWGEGASLELDDV